jgi:beta-mannosidase
MFKRARRSVMFADPPPSPKPRSKFEPLQTLVVATGIWHDVNGEGDTIADVPIPTNIHLDLLRAGKIPDPHLEMNEREVQWVHSRSWKLSTEFYLTVPGFALHQHADLVFEGLDTFATIFLNGKEILKSDNMFQTYRVDITPHVVFMGKQNVLEMVFDSAMARGEELVAKHGERTCVNGHNSRTYVRKAQYQYGWDGGPSLVTCGPWKPIYIDIYNARISHVDCIPLLSPDLRHAVLEIRAKVDAADELNGDLTVSVVIVSPAGVEFISTLGAGTKVSDFRSVRISIPYPELWYPKSHGAQNIYNIDFELKDSCSGKVLHTISQRFGLRHVEIVQNSHPEISVRSVSGESTFYIKINNTPIFCAGSNWISADSFQPRITRETLRAWIADLVGDRGNQSMIRVWGGGVYESEEFYDICDEAGILVWQDIALASADYPAHLDTFASSISMEVKQNLERLRWHPSLVVVAGNSDVHSIPDDKVIVNEKDGQVPSLSEEASSSRYLNENLFPDILKDTCSSSIKVPPYGCVSAGLVYWPGNSFGGKDNTYRTVGGIHQWNGRLKSYDFLLKY